MSVLWRATLDGKYKCEVKQQNSTFGVLSITEGTTKLIERQVSLTYSPIFGPDSMDIAEWEAMSIDIIDKRKQELCE